MDVRPVALEIRRSEVREDPQRGFFGRRQCYAVFFITVFWDEERRWTIARRYSEFDALHRRLLERLEAEKKRRAAVKASRARRLPRHKYNKQSPAAAAAAGGGLLPIGYPRRRGVQSGERMVPPLPPKTAVWVDTTEPEFVEQRQKALHRWLQRVHKHPELLTDPDLGRFLELERALQGVTWSSELSTDSFDFMHVIGQGSYGRVVQVRRKSTGEIFAMKILDKKHLYQRRQVMHTRTERQILAQIRHPFIVSLRFAFQTQTKLYLGLDFFPGGELFFHLVRQRRFPERVVKFYAAEIGLAISYLHENNFVYRDLKPENILLDAEGHIRLTDFGLSKSCIPKSRNSSRNGSRNPSAGDGGSQVTDEESQEGDEDDEDDGDEGLVHTFCGTPQYIAPEVIRGQPYGFAVDWWSYGTLLYELLSGRPPFYHRNIRFMYERILSQPLAFPQGFSAEARNFLQGLLQRNPNRRLGSRYVGYLTRPDGTVVEVSPPQDGQWIPWPLSHSSPLSARSLRLFYFAFCSVYFIFFVFDS